MQDRSIPHPHSNIAFDSQARQAAELAFSGMSRSSPADIPPMVVVKRKKVAAGFECDERLRSADEPRFPRIYRIEPVPTADDLSATAPDTVSTQHADALVSFAGTQADPHNRRRRKRKNGDVTIIRPARPTLNELAQRRMEVVERYNLVLAEIQVLARQAETARQAELKQLLKWIRQAIDDYELDAKDLGL